MINIPQQSARKLIQPNNSDLFGNIYVTKNITFDDAGYLKLSHSPRAAMDENVDGDFEVPAVILWDGSGYFVQTWDDPFLAGSEILGSYPAQITTANFPVGTAKAGAAWFGGLMAVSENADLTYYTPGGGTYTDTNISLTNTSGSQHQVVNFLSLSAMAVADVNTVKLYGTPLSATPTLLTTLTISADFFITGMCYFNQNLYIATQNRYGGHAYMYVWNGLGTAANQVYEVDSNFIFDLCVHKNGIYLLSGNGSLLKFNGGGFTMVAAFPLFFTDQSLADETNISMYKNIMKSNGDLLYINFSNYNNNKRLVDMPDGIWCYDEEVGLYHRYSNSISLVISEVVANVNVNVTTNVITLTATVPVTGTEVYFLQSFGLTPLVDNTKYFVIKLTANTFKLATTKANAIAGTAIDLLVVSGNNTFVFFPNIDYGATMSTGRSSAVSVIERPVAYTQYGTDVLWGGEANKRTISGGDDHLYTVSSGVESRGYFVTPKIFSSNITDTFNDFILKFSPLTSELDKIIIKYRTYDDMRKYIYITEWQVTWTSSTTFTTTQIDFANAVVGNEVEFLSGAAGGLLAHITAISESSGTYTVTIDETYDDYTSGDKSYVVFRNWKKFKTITYGDNSAGQYFLQEQLGATGKFLQLKIELRGIGVRIEELLVDNVYRLPAKSK